MMDMSRSTACASGAVCAVCGEGYEDDETAYVLVTATEAPPDMAAVDVRAMDNGVLHKRCVQLALAMCPKLKSMIADATLGIVEAKGNTARLVLDDDGSAHAVFDGADCCVVSREELRSTR
jgi:hypothetical protein